MGKHKLLQVPIFLVHSYIQGTKKTKKNSTLVLRGFLPHGNTDS